ncbi:MAG: FAD-dependent oxidoreductase [Candidatus Tantalella remota]|nr:FAD-dependent oxidoreductase [Candidatus Tantalella remota]
MDKIYDLIIVGAGPAGITASVYAARKQMVFLVVTEDIGGQTVWSGDIENYTGYQFVTGVELTMKFEEHIKKYEVEVRENEPVTAIEKKDNNIQTTTSKNTYLSKTVIIASGKKARELGVDGEKEFRGKGLAYCATCDAPLFAGKDVVVVGGGNSALEAVLQFIKISPKIYMINDIPALGGDPIMREKVLKAGNVTVINNSVVKSVEGDKFVERVKYLENGEEKELSVQGVFVEIGLVPNTSFQSDIEKNDVGEIKVNNCNETNIPGVFAAGDVTDVPEKQIIIAAGEGAKATLKVFNYISRIKETW